MKSLLLTLKITLLSLPLAASLQVRPNLMLHCLAKEEATFHKNKMVGPYYKLNQLFINEMSQVNDIHVKKSYLKGICNSPEHNPSLALLKSLIIDGTKIFEFKVSDENVGLSAFKSSGIKELRKRAPHILFSFLGQLQGQGPDPHCFRNKMPEIIYFLSRYRYLEEEYQVEELVDDKKKLQKVFNKLRSVDQIIKGCTDSYYKKRKKNRSSKK